MKHVAEIQPSGDSIREPEFPHIEQKGGADQGEGKTVFYECTTVFWPGQGIGAAERGKFKDFFISWRGNAGLLANDRIDS